MFLWVENSKGFVISNNNIVEDNEEIKKALTERLHTIEFKNKHINTTENINTLLIKEEPEIIIFCNKIYFNSIVWGGGNIKN